MLSLKILKLSLEKAKASETTEQVALPWGTELADKKVWHPADIKKQTFLEDETRFIVASNKDAYEIDKLPTAFGSTTVYYLKNLRCPLGMYGCVSNPTQLLHPHKVMVLQHPNGPLEYVLLSDEETVRMEDAIRNGELGADVFEDSPA